MPKKTKEKPKARTKIEKEVLQALSNTLNSGNVEDEVFKRIKKRILTKERINSICAVLDNIKESNPQSYLYYIGYFTSIYDRHKALEQKLALERERMELQRIQISKTLAPVEDVDESPANLIEQMYSAE